MATFVEISKFPTGERKFRDNHHFRWDNCKDGKMSGGRAWRCGRHEHLAVLEFGISPAGTFLLIATLPPPDSLCDNNVVIPRPLTKLPHARMHPVQRALSNIAHIRCACRD
jgi:hypothetical protein